MIQKRPDKPARNARGGARGGKGSQGGSGSRRGASRRGRTAGSGEPSDDGDAALAASTEVEAKIETEDEAERAAPDGEPSDGLRADADGPSPAASGTPAGEDASDDGEAAAADGVDEAAPGERARRKAPREPVDVDDLSLRLEALLFASGQVLGVRRLASALEVTGDDVHAGMERLTARWAGRETAIEVVEVSGGWRLVTKADWHEDVARLTAKARTEKLSPAALETLAVVAYRQPIGRADIEAVRGVQCGPLLRVLLDRDLIRITGRSPEPGHPLLYGTTRRFLDHFGLASLKNLPDVKDLLNVS